jgi:hypothetical protein
LRGSLEGRAPAILLGASHHDLCIGAEAGGIADARVIGERRVREDEHFMGVLLRGDGDLHAVLAEGDDVIALREGSAGEAQHVVGNAVEHSEPEDKA